MMAFAVRRLTIATLIAGISILTTVPLRTTVASIRSTYLQTAIADSFDFPLSGAHLIVNGGYGDKNPALTRVSTCYAGKKISELYHAGEDWKAPAGTPVKAVANGKVVYADPKFDYRAGNVVIIEHTPADGTLIYSMYGHLTKGELKVSTDGADSKPNVVQKGDEIGTLIYQSYVDDQNKTQDNSHLHFEIRTFADGGFLCGNKDGVFPAGPGYTYPDHPDMKGYKNPSQFIREHQSGSISNPSAEAGARLTVLPKIPVIKPGETATITLRIQNTGTADWPAEGNITLSHINGDMLGITSPQPLLQAIPAGREATWELSVKKQDKPGVYDSIWRMAKDGEPFGDSIRLAVIVVPKGSSADFVQIIQAMITDAQRQVTDQFDAAWEDLKRRIEQRIEEEVQKEARRRLPCIFGLVPAGILFVGVCVQTRRRGRKVMP